LNEGALNKLGGVKALEAKLKTDYKRGLKSDPTDLENRRKTYGRNEVGDSFFLHLLG
jgi:hypothetical protein